MTSWLTGYTREQLLERMDAPISYGDFFREAPARNPDRVRLKGSVRGVRLDAIEDPLLREI